MTQKRYKKLLRALLTQYYKAKDLAGLGNVYATIRKVKTDTAHASYAYQYEVVRNVLKN